MSKPRQPPSRRVRSRAPRAAPAQERTKYFSKVIGKALDTLDILRSSPEPLSLNDLTLRVGLAKTSLFRILRTLETAHYVERDARGRYRIAGGLSSASPRQRQDTLVRAAVPRMRELVRTFGETVSVAMRFENHIEVVATLESPQLIRMGNTVGRILPPHASSLGKAILAFQPEEQRELLIRSYGLHRFTPHTVVDEMQLKEELEAVRARRYSTDTEESVLEGCCFGAPIRGTDGEVLSAISLSMPRMRLRDDELRERLIAAFRRAADAISADLTLPSTPRSDVVAAAV